MYNKISFCIVIIFAAAFLSGIELFGETITVKLGAGEYSWEFCTNKGDNIITPQFGMINIPGKPRMPSKTFCIAVPPDAEVSNVTFSGKTKELEGLYNIEPAELVLPAREFTQEEYSAAKKERDRNYMLVYSSNDPFPAKFAENLGVGPVQPKSSKCRLDGAYSGDHTTLFSSETLDDQLG